MKLTKVIATTGTLTIAVILAFALYMLFPHSNESKGIQIEKKVTVATIDPPTRIDLLNAVNAQRTKNGVTSLIIDERLNSSAQVKAEDMVKNHYFGHIDKNGHHGYELAHEYAPDICNTASENLVWQTDGSSITVEGAMNWWENSKHHYQAMIDKNYHWTGFGIVKDAIVEHFC
jgi:uncharacterized protein YkwD